MIRFTRFSVLLTLLTVTGLQSYPAIELPVVAQTSICAPDQTLDTDEYALRDQARVALDNGDLATTVRTLREALLITPRTQYPHNTVEQWLLEDNNGTRIEQLLKFSDKKQTTQILDQLYQITQRLKPNHSSIKTRAFAAIAKSYIVLNQFPSAINALNQARDAVRFVQGTTEKADRLLDIAAGYAALPQPQIAQTSLTQAEKAIQQIQQSDRAVRLVRLAALHAEDENFTKARAIAAKLPKNSESHAIVFRAIAENYIRIKQLGNADQAIQTITHPMQKAIALGKVAVAYERAQQPGIATKRFDQAMAIAATPNLVSGFYTSEMLRRDLVVNLVEVGRRDAARRLAINSEMPSFKKEAYKVILLADVRANEPVKAKKLLSQQLTEILNQQDSSWHRFELVNLINTATEAEQFDWFIQEWNRISKVDFGLTDQDVERITTSHAQKGRHLQALQWTEKLPIANRPVLQIRLKSTIALAAHQSGQTAWAKNLLQTTEQQISALMKASRDRLQREGGDTNEPDDIEYIGVAVLALSYAQIGDTGTTQRLLDRVVKSKMNQNDMQLGGRIDNPFELFREANQIDGAFQLANGSVLPEKRFQRLQTVAGMALAQNRFDMATSIVPRLNSASGQTQLLLAIAQRYTQLKQTDKALPFLAQAFKVAQTIPGEESQFDRLGAEGGTVIEMENDRGSLIEAIAVQYARLKQPAQALKVANTLKEKKTRDQALEKVRCAISS